VRRLDSRGARNLMKVLRRVAESGRTIICSIHQPSSEVFGMFDQVLVLQGGSLVYDGDVGPRSKP
jgi:ATP-binding cassette subfamily G (WHITE) protein 2 (SNQ2)